MLMGEAPEEEIGRMIEEIDQGRYARNIMRNAEDLLDKHRDIGIREISREWSVCAEKNAFFDEFLDQADARCENWLPIGSGE
jgi:hypothetical protein